MPPTNFMDLLHDDILGNAAAAAGWKGLVPDIRALWTSPIAGEEGAPRHRIVHSRLVQLHAPARLHRLGLRPAVGYTKCGSHPQIDRVTSFRVIIWDGSGWIVHRAERNVPDGDGPLWFDLEGVSTASAMIEARSCEIDGWWTSWNLVQGAFILEGELDQPAYSQKECRLKLGEIDTAHLPAGVELQQHPGELRFRAGGYEVGFWLGRAGFSYLALDGAGNTTRNLLRSSPAVSLQGPRSRPVGAAPVIAPLIRNDISGHVTFRGDTVTYSLRLNGQGQEYKIEWRVLADRLGFRMTRRGERALRMWESSAWKIVCDSEITPTTVLGRILRKGETGLLALPVLFDAPGHGTLKISGNEGLCRSDSHRPLTLTSLEFKVGEIPQPEGDYLLPEGEHVLEGEMTLFTFPRRSSAPQVVADALQRRSISAITYRADTATLTNNGNSMHAPLCMDNWSAIATRVGSLLPGLSAADLLRDTLERWLDGGPGYASGGMAGIAEHHRAEDEYIMTGAAGLLGLAEYLLHCGDDSWLTAYEHQIARQLEQMRRRDLDNDGLVESPFRDGISGGHEWSTNWYDVISFGWKDAFSNALLYRALVILGDVLPRLGKPDLAYGVTGWGEKLREHYFGAFFNPQTGWLAGWRDKTGLLHDYAFLFVNGAAVCSGVIDNHRSAEVIGNLWREAQRIGLPDPRLGLPGNLWPVADHDMVGLMHGKPMGYYLNGALTHSQSRHFVGALYVVGMSDVGDLLLSALCETLADGSAFGGCNSGIDWRYWDGGPCGYEGILTDQFGILAVAIDRYGTGRGI